jgi:hypothetical protein
MRSTELPLKARFKRWMYQFGLDRLDLNRDLDNRYIYFHVPKTAGTAIAQGLGLPRTYHTSYRRAEYYLDTEIERYFTFSFVRNPFDRFLSLYYYARLDQSAHHSSLAGEKSTYGKHSDYDLLKNASLKECAQYLLEGRLQHDRHWNHWKPQSFWLKNERDEINLDFIGRFETIEESVQEINARLETNITLQKTNASRASSDYSAMYDTETKGIISKYYAEDLDRFEYQF